MSEYGADISLLDERDHKRCRVRNCPMPRASHFVVWTTKAGASSSYRCRVHAHEFASSRGLTYPETAEEIAYRRRFDNPAAARKEG